MKGVVSALTAYVVLGLTLGQVALLWPGGWTIATTNSALVGLAALALLLLFKPDVLRGAPSLAPFLAAAFFLLLTDYTRRRFGFFISHQVFIEVIVLGFICLLIHRLNSYKSLFHPLTLLLLQIFLTVVFLRYADGRLIFSDDHPSFMYRFKLLEQHFPAIPFYNPDWNAGYSAHEFFPTGMLNVYLFSKPLLLFFPDISLLENVHYYTYLVAYLFIFVLPWMLYAAGKLLFRNDEAAVLGAILGMIPSMSYLESLLAFGTIGFAFSAGLVPIVLALSGRMIFSREVPSWATVCLLVAVATLCLFWTLSLTAFIPLVVLSLVFWKTTFQRPRIIKLSVFIALFLLINWSWLLTFVEVSNVVTFVAKDRLPGTIAAEAHTISLNFSELLKDFRKLLIKINPLILLFSVPAIFLIIEARTRWLWLLTLVWLGSLAFFGKEIKPQLELNRMLTIASFIMAVLSGGALAELYRRFLSRLQKSTCHWHRLGLVVLCGSVAVTFITVCGGWLNRADHRYVFAPVEFSELVEGVGKHGGTGRTFFLGFILQELGAATYASQDGGHVAPLARFSGKPMYASHYYHRYWKTVDPIPHEYRRRGEEGIEEFLDLVNATAVVTFKREWADYCLRRPRYKQVLQTGRFRLFIRETESDYFLEGSGIVQAMGDGIRVQPNATELVLKYRYFPRLRVKNLVNGEGVEIFPVSAFAEDIGGGKTEPVNFIGIKVSDAIVESGTWIELGF